ncbi:MAG: 50S ribosomal protein L10 [Deltaproteobacteria bacterium]|jgi:large subunit ribosomal protein L10|nr:50S ribosomal protein L10 [Deltaproteobacteria bacterium]
MDKSKKKLVLSELETTIAESTAIFVTDFKGLPVGTLNQLRQKVRNAKGTLRVTKNTLARLALGEGKSKAIKSRLSGNNALAFTKEDPVSLAKALVEFAKEESRFVLKGGVLGSGLLEPGDIKTLSSLPSKEALVGSFLGTLNAVPGSFVRVLAGVPQKFLRLLTAVGEQKSKEAA